MLIPANPKGGAGGMHFEEYENEVSHYRTALICRNGHTATDDIEGYPERKQRFCKECGAENISTCPECGESIHGYHHTPGVVGLFPYVPPKYCHNCGQPYPWTRTRLDSLRELVEETAGLGQDEKAKLARSLNDLVTDTPKTEVAAMRVKKWLASAGREIGTAARGILVDVATEAAKKH